MKLSFNAFEKLIFLQLKRFFTHYVLKTLAQKDKLERYDPRSKTFFSSRFAVQPPDREGVLGAADAGPQVPRRRVFQRLRPSGHGHQGGGAEGHGRAALQGHRHTAQVWLKERTATTTTTTGPLILFI